MIIKNNNISNNETNQKSPEQTVSSQKKISSQGNIIKKEDLIIEDKTLQNPPSSLSEEKKDNALPLQNPPEGQKLEKIKEEKGEGKGEDENKDKNKPEQKDIKAPVEKEEKEEGKEEEKGEDELGEFEKIDISSIEFKERIERRRGDRRRGYRRIDERSLVSRAQQEAHSIKELASREGYENGLKKANEEIQEVKNRLGEFLGAKDEMYESFYPHIMELSLEIAKKIINKEVEMSPDVLKNVIMSVLDEMNSDAERITIKVNPTDVEFALASLPEIVETKRVDAKLSVSSDDTVEKGSCIVIANNGVIDANFKTQLAVLQNAFGIYKGGI